MRSISELARKDAKVPTGRDRPPAVHFRASPQGRKVSNREGPPRAVRHRLQSSALVFNRLPLFWCKVALA